MPLGENGMGRTEEHEAIAELLAPRDRRKARASWCRRGPRSKIWTRYAFWGIARAVAWASRSPNAQRRVDRRSVARRAACGAHLESSAAAGASPPKIRFQCATDKMSGRRVRRLPTWLARSSAAHRASRRSRAPRRRCEDQLRPGLFRRSGKTRESSGRRSPSATSTTTAFAIRCSASPALTSARGRSPRSLVAPLRHRAAGSRRRHTRCGERLPDRNGQSGDRRFGSSPLQRMAMMGPEQKRLHTPSSHLHSAMSSASPPLSSTHSL